MHAGSQRGSVSPRPQPRARVARPTGASGPLSLPIPDRPRRLHLPHVPEDCQTREPGIWSISHSQRPWILPQHTLRREDIHFP